MRWFCLLIFLECFVSAKAMTSWWLLGMPSTYQTMLTQMSSSYQDFCKNLNTFKDQGRDICSLTHKTLQTIGQGAKLGIDECQYQFRNSRWNCSTFSNIPSVFGGVLNVMSREKAYVYAVSSAGVGYAITRACSRGELNDCGCDFRIRHKETHGRWQWGGCSDDVQFGVKFSRDFVDTGENATSPQGLMNLHNNEAGRRTLRANAELTCKCHGVSGSCSMRVCWRRLKGFRNIGDDLYRRFEGSTHVHMVMRPRRNSNQYDNNNNITTSNSNNSNNETEDKSSKVEGGGGMTWRLRTVDADAKRPSKRDLVYIDESPDYCLRNETIGVLGTTGRECNVTSYGMDGCRLLCCGRGYITIEKIVQEKCNCKFVWCCRVQCKICLVKKKQHFCR